MRQMVLSQEDMIEAIQDYCEKHMTIKRFVSCVTPWDSKYPQAAIAIPQEFMVSFKQVEALGSEDDTARIQGMINAPRAG